MYILGHVEIQRTNTEEVKKLKAIAVKLKKELGEAKGKVKENISVCCKGMSIYRKKA